MDLGFGGILLETDNPLPVGAAEQIEFRVEDEHIGTMAVVRHVGALEEWAQNSPQLLKETAFTYQRC